MVMIVVMTLMGMGSISMIVPMVLAGGLMRCLPRVMILVPVHHDPMELLIWFRSNPGKS